MANTNFTVLLDEYLKAKQEYDEAWSAFSGYDFSFFHWREVEQLDKARDALNAAIAPAPQES